MGMVGGRDTQVHPPEPGVSGVRQKHEELIPLNPRLWKLVVMQAKARFHRWPSPAASKWAHDKYKQLGGRFRTKREDEDKLASHQKIDKSKDDIAAEKEAQKEEKKRKDEKASGRKNVKGRHFKKKHR